MVANKTCLCCGTKFSHCPDCSKADALKPSWASQFCCEECAKIWETATKYNINKLSKSEAKEIISTLALKPIDKYVKCVQRDLGVILAEEPKPKRGKRAQVAVVEETIPETVVEEINPVISDDTVHEVVYAIEN